MYLSCRREDVSHQRQPGERIPAHLALLAQALDECERLIPRPLKALRLVLVVAEEILPDLRSVALHEVLDRLVDGLAGADLLHEQLEVRLSTAETSH